MKQYSAFTITLLFFSASIFGQVAKEKYYKLKIYTDQQGLLKLAAAGVAIDEGEIKKGF
jgi:hypothetical protein